VVIGLTPDEITFHDPMAEKGATAWPLQKFVDHWQETGENVIAGASMVVLRERHPDLLSVEEVRAILEEHRAQKAGAAPPQR
jgi:hypothetical protein